MSTAQILFEQYNVLPKRVCRELKTLIANHEEEMTLMEGLEQSLKEMKLPKRNIRDVLKDERDKRVGSILREKFTGY